MCDYLLHAKFCHALEGREHASISVDTLHIHKRIVIAVIVIDSFSQGRGAKKILVHLSSRCPVTIGYQNRGGGLGVHFAGMSTKKRRKKHPNWPPNNWG